MRSLLMDALPLPPEPAARRRLGAALALSIALHVLVMGQKLGLPGGEPERFSGALPAIELRLLGPAHARPDARGGEAAGTEPLEARAERASDAREASEERQAAAAASPPGIPGPSPQAIEARPRQYYPASALERSPVALHTPPLPEPPASAAGRVSLRLLINAEGGVDQALVDESVPPGMFERWASLAFRKARFTPGLRAGEPVASQLRIEIVIGAAGAATGP
ncbi:MAG: energy transducer TonB [Burkholderiales bacterium]|nr:energy transducer TonB [Burkholderiales bacterium]